ncbi:MAG: hypothetical protein KJO31_11635 [Gammaproteobacteria bacterium]|nr:hypothetical protein [Gammaproteobacteria bacterium]
MYQFVSVVGPDASEFLQGQLTQDVDRVTDTGILPAAWCNAKGRVYATMYIAAAPDGLILVMPANACAEVMQRLVMYRFRAKVELAVADDRWRAMALSDNAGYRCLEKRSLLPEPGATASCAALHIVRPLSASDFVEIYGHADALRDSGLRFDVLLDDDEWLAHRIRAGLATVDAHNREKFTPHMLNLDRVGAISFTKGCYTGQEIVARTENLGRSRRRLGYFKASAPGIEVGQKVSDAQRDIGDVVNVAGTDVLAVFPHEGNFGQLQAGGISLRRERLPYDL